MTLPPSQAKTAFSYLFVMGLGAYMGHQYFGKWGALLGFGLAIPVAIVIGLSGIFILAQLLGYSSKRANQEGDGG